MRILGIDPGTGITGFGVIELPGTVKSSSMNDYKLIDAGVIRTVANSPHPERLQIIYENMCEVIDSTKPDCMSIEKLFFTNNITTAMTVSQARGVVMLAAQQRGLEIAEYTPLQIKQAVTGYGKAEKAQMQEMVKVILRLAERPKPDDCADALAAAICHAMTL